MKIDFSYFSAATITRFIILALALINQVLSVTGHPILPIDESQIEMLVSTLFTIGTALVGYWYDNDITAQAIERKAVISENSDADKSE